MDTNTPETSTGTEVHGVVTVSPKPKWFPPNGAICARCGGLMLQTGTCHTCTQCGDSTGCG